MLYALVPFMLSGIVDTQSEILNAIASEEEWYSQSLSLVTGGGSRQLIAARDTGIIIVDSDVWPKTEIQSFAASRFRTTYGLRLSEEGRNAIETQLKSRTQDLSLEEPEDE